MGLGGNKDKAMRNPYCITFGEYMGDEMRASGRGRSFNFTSLMLAFRMLKDGYEATNDGFKGQHIFIQGKQEIVRHEAARKMRVGPSGSACRSRLQTTLSCCGKEPW
jgi:hypothetical protein